MIKRFKTYLNEAHLSTTQRNGFLDYAARRNLPVDLDTPSKKAQEISGKVMPDTVELPMMNSTMQAIHDHLKSNGYSEVDYGNKVAHRDIVNKMGISQRITTNIGKALTQTKADKGLIDSFNNDNHKEAADLASKYKVIISRVPRHIAACSTNTPWSSCARLDTWGNPSVANNNGFGDPKGREEPEKWELDQHAAGHLPQEIKQGSHVAYMVPNREDTHENLIRDAHARIMIKPFISDYGDTVLSSESKGYIAGHKDGVQVPQGFKDTVNNFTNTNFPMETNIFYTKHPNVYNDDRQNKRINFDINKPFYAVHSLNGEEITKGLSRVSSTDITNYLDKIKTDEPIDNRAILVHLPTAANFNNSHFKQMIHPDIFNRLGAYETRPLLNKITKSEDMDSIVKNMINGQTDHEYTFGLVNDHPLFSSKHADMIYNSPKFNSENHPYFKQALLHHKAFTGKSLEDAISKSQLDGTYSHVIINPNLNSTHIDHIINNISKYDKHTIGFVSKHGSKFSSQNIDDILKTNIITPKNVSFYSTNLTDTLISNPNFKLNHFIKTQNNLKYAGDISYLDDAALDKHDPEINDYLTNDAIKNNNYSRIKEIANNHTFSTKQIDDIVDKVDIGELFYNSNNKLIYQPNFNSEHVKKLFTSENSKKLSIYNATNFADHILHGPKKHLNTFIDNIPNQTENYGELFRLISPHYETAEKMNKPEILNKLHENDQNKIAAIVAKYS